MKDSELELVHESNFNIIEEVEQKMLSVFPPDWFITFVTFSAGDALFLIGLFQTNQTL